MYKMRTMPLLSRSLILFPLLLSAATSTRFPEAGNLRLRGGGDVQLRNRAGQGPSLVSFLSASPSTRSGASGALGSSRDLDDMKQYVEKSIVIEASPDEVFRVASGFEKYPKWAGCNWIRVLKRTVGGLGFQVQMKVGMFGRNLDYVLQYQYHRPHKMTWHAVRGSIKALQGSYEFLPGGRGTTKVVYKLNVDPGFWVPLAVKSATTRLVASAALNGLKKYTELPSTLEELRGKCGPRMLTEQEILEDRKRVYMLRMALM
uniref:Coenzyme Q-binding protein COQ10 START domain-containing protein n=1 Tax=Hemiselmis andersenii TaxID=464988 RepID=A0A6U2H0T6_HEMAN|mmetsp:Transcript_39277/g.91792  ORF Transcript_39277/g.91792 Transcript_39277/m.91792 type:complete len:260 (+) Transcript_39277:204-983(+)|eukprot:CAMPEP_0114124908 /NCGR_PEP_ID=MMETSP0043_2-20121206/9026_1 /TAXON_ID=464988 /ORGANISM="Hemiselmis andersenii, Strain CCMP644" /LENGTH=259 /DNA_ID=CAMNT_0001217815 /DNA_START=200 /DNA_END=979 /DNA_ORIENTATION=+